MKNYLPPNAGAGAGLPNKLPEVDPNAGAGAGFPKSPPVAGEPNPPLPKAEGAVQRRSKF